MLVASLTWVTQKHECFGNCDELTAQTEPSHCALADVHQEVKNSTDCCGEENNKCNDKNCCVDEKIVLDRTISEFSREDSGTKRAPIFDFLFAPFTQKVISTVALPDSIKLEGKTHKKCDKGQVSHFIRFSNFRC